MDVVQRRVGGEMMFMHESQNRSQVIANEVASLLVQKKTKSSLSTPQDDEVFQVVDKASTGASPQALLTSEAGVVGETRYVEEFSARNMKLVSEIHTKEAGETDHFETKCFSLPARKLSCSEEASVDVHSEDSEKDFLKTVCTVDHVLLQKNSEELAGVPQEVEAEPSLFVKWSHEVSVDIIIPDDWVEVEAGAEAKTETETEASVAETEVLTSGVAPSLESGKPSPLDRVDVEPVDSNLATEHETPSIKGVIEQGRELVSKPVDIQVGEASKNAVFTSTQDDDIDLKPCPSPLTGGKAGEPMAWEFVQPTQVETIDVTESCPCSSESTNLDRIAPDVDSNIQHLKSTVRVLSFADWERPVDSDAGTMVEESTSAPPNLQTEGIKEQPQRIWSLKNLKRRPLVEPRSAVSEPAVRHVKPKAPTVVGLPWPPTPLTSAPTVVGLPWPPTPLTSAPTVVGLPWPPTPLISAEGKLCVGTDDAVESTDTELRESASSPSEGMEASIKEQKHLQRLWSLQYLKTRPAVVEPGMIATAQRSSSLKPVKLKAPKVVGLSWPPAPLTTAPGVFS